MHKYTSLALSDQAIHPSFSTPKQPSKKQ